MLSRCHVACALSVFSMALLFSSPAAAQDAPVGEFSVGYNLLRFEENTVPAGWYADVAANVSNALAVVGQVTGNYESEEGFGVEVDASYYTFMAGIRFSARTNPNFVPFGQVLAGGARSKFSTEAGGIDLSESNTDGALQIGGGVNLFGGGSIGARVGADYIRVFTEGEGTNAFRFAAGVVFGF